MVKIYESNDIKIKSAVLLSEDEVKKYLGIPYTENYDTGLEWWTRTIDIENKVVFVNINGEFDSMYPYETLDICPALVVSGLKVGDRFSINGYEFKMISNNLAFIQNQSIGYGCFYEDKFFNSEVFTYNSSDVKKLVDNWFNKEIKNQEIKILK